MIKAYLDILEYPKILTMISEFSVTEVGKNFCLNLVPFFSYEKVSNLLEESKEAMKLLHEKGQPPFLPISDLTETISFLESGGVLSNHSLLEMKKLLSISFLLKEYFLGSNDYSPTLSPYFLALYQNPILQSSIENKILDDTCIADDASSSLLQIRKALQQTEERINQTLTSFIHSRQYAKYIQEPVITIRNDRFVIPIKEEYRSSFHGFIHDISSSGSTVFMEPVSVFDLNNKRNHLKAEEISAIQQILKELSFSLATILKELKQNLHIICTLDAIFAKANYAISINGICPNLNKEHQLLLIEAKHPLLAKENAVPISLSLGNEFSTLVITGPNTGGKTVSLKTVGLLTLMTFTGIPIPANEASSFYVFDQVFADIGDEQSIQESLSTFSSHIRNIITILTNCTKDSLVLLDELGSGTDPIEGSSLAISILEEFYSRGLLTISTTHYPEIKNYALTTSGFENASCEFDLENLRPTYRLLVGIPGKSNAFAISKKLGLPEKIITRATTLVHSDAISMEELLKAIYDDKITIDKEKEIVRKNLSQAQLLRDSLETQLSSISKKEEKILEKAKEEARKILQEAKEEASTAIKEIQNLADSSSMDAVRHLNQIRNSLTDSIKSNSSSLISPLSSDSTLNKESLSIGMEVFVTTLNQQAVITSLSSKGERVQVQIGSAKMNIPIHNLQLVTTPKKQDQCIHSKKSSSFQPKMVHSEINVIGHNVEEAIFLIDKYLDDCAISKFSPIRIVHGKGTGILRKGIHDFLKKNPHVDSFRLGTFGEGEMGVTIVTLK